jgi:hypothetical protein
MYRETQDNRRIYWQGGGRHMFAMSKQWWLQIGRGAPVTQERVLTTNRGTEISFGVLHTIVGVLLTLLIMNYIGESLILRTTRWYDSYWLPLCVACLVYLCEALWLRLPIKWLYGLLITAPPYGWYAGLATTAYIESRSDVTRYLKVALPALLLALSGAVLNPVIAKLVAYLKANRRMSPTE